MKITKKIGLIGGMGPFASARFLQILLEKCATDFGAKDGSDFPEIILDSVPIDDFISDKTKVPEARRLLIPRVKKLAKHGCVKIAMVCNTGHILFPILSKASGGKMISLIESVLEEAEKRKMKRVGLLATKTTIESKLFENTKLTVVNPNPKLLALCETAIRKAIANKDLRLIRRTLKREVDNFIKNEDLDGIILGCTELPLVFNHKLKNFIDCLDVLSDKILKIHYE